MIDRLDLASWMHFDAAHGAPTFFARPAWARAVAKTWPSLEAAPLCIAHDGVSCLVPVVRTKDARVPFREYLGFPMGGYTAVLRDDGGLADDALAAAVIAKASHKVDHLRVAPWPLQPIGTLTGAQVRMHETAVIDCRQGFDAVWSRVRGVTRRMVGQSQRRGVVVERGGAADAGAYYALLEHASHGWGLEKPTIPRALLEHVLELGGDDAQLWFVRADGEIIAGGVVLFGNDELFFWSAAMRREFTRFRPSNALNARLIEEACTRGVSWYNLGASEGLAGVARFKAELGATPMAYSELDFAKPGFRAYRRLRAGFSGVKKRA